LSSQHNSGMADASTEETQCKSGDDNPSCHESQSSLSNRQSKTEECADFHPQCSYWANNGQCVLNPEYMSNACRDSCWLCVDEDKLRNEDDWTEEAIQRRKVYANFDPGVEQVVEGTEDESKKVEHVLTQMERYARYNVTEQLANLPTDLAACRNDYKLCAFWASVGECEHNFAFSVTNCPLACRFCEHAVDFERCGIHEGSAKFAKQFQEDPPTVLKNGFAELYKSLQQQQQQPVEKKMDGSICSSSPIVQPGDDYIGDDSWVLRFENFLTSVECDNLVKLATGIGWKASLVDTSVPNPPRRTSQSAICTLGIDDNCAKDETYVNLLNRIASLLDIPVSHIEPIEFVKYEKGESWGGHSDFQFMDTWKPAGPRVLSLFLTLSADPTIQGGALGFPDLDWTFVKPQVGEAIVWPNAMDDDPRNKANDAMKSEGLPVLEGTKVGAHVWIRMHDYREAYERGCV